MENFGAQFLHKDNQKLHTSLPVEHEKIRRRKIGEKTPEKPAEKITDWLGVIEKTHMGHEDNPEVLERIKTSYHKEYVIKLENIPESAFLLEQRIARTQGHGTIEITDEYKEQKKEEIIGNQEKSLDKWIDYLSSSDAMYPIWAKYWAFNSMLKMGKLEKEEDSETKAEKAKFRKREKDTIASFPPLNPRALAMTISAITSKAEENVKDKKERKGVENMSKKLDETEFKNLLNSENFSKIYTQFLIEMPEYSKEGLRETRGKWVKYEQGGEPDELVKSLEGYPLEWCTANIDTARAQLKGGDFYIYYSINEDGEAKIPRVAIRMENNNIAEVRGIAPDQNVDPYISDVVKEKMTEFPDSKEYEKKSEDMKRLTEIEEKNNYKQELTKDDLRFLYQIDSTIDGFGHHEDPRIKELIDKREIKSDLSIATGFSENEISINTKEFLNGSDIKYHYGNLDLQHLYSGENLKLPETVSGKLDLGKLIRLDGLKLPKKVGSLYLSNLTSPLELKLPETISGNLYLGGLKSVEGLKFPRIVEGDLDLEGLIDAKGLELPEGIGGTLYLKRIKSAIGVKLPRYIGGGLRLNSLTSVKGLVLPEHIGWRLELGSITSVNGLKLSETIVEGNINLDNLTSIEGFELPKDFKNEFELYNLPQEKKDKLLKKFTEIKIHDDSNSIRM